MNVAHGCVAVTCDLDIAWSRLQSHRADKDVRSLRISYGVQNKFHAETLVSDIIELSEMKCYRLNGH